MPFDNAIRDAAGLRTVYREPHPAVRDKHIDHVDDGSAGFIARSPFVVLATTSPRGTDASPRGGPPGFVRVLDRRRLAIGDLSGNNRLDSYANIVEHPQVGLLFLVPGVGETLRINGRAGLTVDPAVLDACVIDGRRPRVALGVDVDECYLHCAKAFRRSGLWDPGTWPDPEVRPRAAAIWRDQLSLDVDTDVIERDLEADYQHTLWLAGGCDTDADTDADAGAEL